MGRRPCCAKEGVNRGAWSAQEDRILTSYINTHGEGQWRELPERAGLKRCGKSCRLRWLNYLRPDIKRGNISPEEEDLIIRLHNLLGNRWSLIAGRLPGRTDNEIKNHWNTHLSKKVMNGQSPKTSTQEHIKTKSQGRRSSKEISIEARLENFEPHQVIRTKAVRCSKLFFPLREQQADPVSAIDTGVGDVNEITPIIPPEDDYLNFLKDFDMGELFVEDTLDTDHCTHSLEIQEKSNAYNGADDGGHNLSSSFYERLSFSEAVLDDWRESNGVDLVLELFDIPLIMKEASLEQ